MSTYETTSRTEAIQFCAGLRDRGFEFEPEPETIAPLEKTYWTSSLSMNEWGERVYLVTYTEPAEVERCADYDGNECDERARKPSGRCERCHLAWRYRNVPGVRERRALSSKKSRQKGAK